MNHAALIELKDAAPNPPFSINFGTEKFSKKPMA